MKNILHFNVLDYTGLIKSMVFAMLLCGVCIINVFVSTASLKQVKELLRFLMLHGC